MSSFGLKFNRSCLSVQVQTSLSSFIRQCNRLVYTYIIYRLKLINDFLFFIITYLFLIIFIKLITHTDPTAEGEADNVSVDISDMCM